MTPAHRRSVVAFALVALCCARAAHAQSASPTPDARSLVQDGVRLRREGRDADALASFQRAFAADPRPSTQAQIGFALQALGRWVEAERELSRVIAVDDPWVSRQRAVIEDALTTVRSHLGSLEFVCAPAGAEVLVDGRSIGRAPIAEPIRLAAGNVTVTARLDGYYSIERVFTVQAGDRARETLELQRREPEVTQSTSAAQQGSRSGASTQQATASQSNVGAAPRSITPVVVDRAGSRRWIAPAVLTGVGAASLGAGVAMIFARNASIAEIAAAGCVETATTFDCPQPGSDLDRATRAQLSAQTASTASAALLITGGVMAVGGAVWLVVERVARPSERAPARAQVRWRGLSVEGQF